MFGSACFPNKLSPSNKNTHQVVSLCFWRFGRSEKLWLLHKRSLNSSAFAFELDHCFENILWLGRVYTAWVLFLFLELLSLSNLYSAGEKFSSHAPVTGTDVERRTILTTSPASNCWRFWQDSIHPTVAASSCRLWTTLLELLPSVSLGRSSCL